MDSEAWARSNGLRRSWLVALGVWLTLAAVASIALWHLRANAVDSQKRELRLLSLALSDAIERGLRGAEEGLHTMRAELQEGRLLQDDGSASPSLHVRAGLMPLVQTLWVVDDGGHVIAASGSASAPDLTGFDPPLDRKDAGATSLSRPFVEPDGTGPQLALAVRFEHAPGAGSGWIVASMPVGALLGAFGAALPAADARMWIYRADGARLAGANVPQAELDGAVRTMRPARSPDIAVRRFADGSDNLLGLHVVPDHDIEVVVSRDLASVLEPWHQVAEGAAAALALMLVIMGTAVHFVQRADRRRAEAQHALQVQGTRAGRLEALGTLAGGVAHDFNNVLAAIAGFGEMAQDGAAPGSAQARHLEKVLQAARRGKALVERILAFSRGGARSSTVFELEPVVEEVLTLLSASLRFGIVLERALEAPGACLRGDPTQVFEAVMNLCTNAMQAMPDGGMLSVQVARLQVPEPQVLSHTRLAAGDYVTLAVSDQGGGITPEVMEHLFEPFFTTRAAQSGTGLGLAVVFGVVAEFGGAIDVTSRPGHGACFTLYLPECKADPAAAEAGRAPAAVGTGQRLMVVDDEPALVALAEEMLAGLGYVAVGFTDAAAALQALKDDPHGFAAVITDEVMPGLSGTRLTQALRDCVPDLPVLMVSGYGGALLAQRAAAAGVTRLLGKPLQRAELAAALAELLR